MTRVLLLAGTTEARRIAGALVADGSFHVIASLAGTTSSPVQIGHAMRTGGFGGAEGLANYIAGQRIDLLVDATHPFATRMKASAAAQSVPVLHVIRPAWDAQPGDRWHPVADLPAAALALPHESRAFLALGRRHLTAFQAVQNQAKYVRSIEAAPVTPHDDRPARAGNGAFTFIQAPPGDAVAEQRMLHDLGITHLVCRNSGGPAGYGKIAAARALGLPVIMVVRPAPPSGNIVETAKMAVIWCRRLSKRG